jgi:hypothetical protein
MSQAIAFFMPHGIFAQFDARSASHPIERRHGNWRY